MAITAHLYTLALAKLVSATPVNWTADTIQVALVTASYTPAQDVDSFWSTAQPFEITGPGYVAGGVVVGGKSVGAVSPTHEIPLLGGNSVWAGASFTCRYAIVYKNTGSPATSPLLGWVDFGTNETVASGTFTVQWDAINGILALSAA